MYITTRWCKHTYKGNKIKILTFSKQQKKTHTNLKVYKNKQTKKKTQQTNKEKNSQLLTKVPELVTYTCLTGAIYSALSQLRVGWLRLKVRSSVLIDKTMLG